MTLERVERIDGHRVSRYSTNFLGSVEVDSSWAEQLRIGNVTVWILAGLNGKMSAELDKKSDGDEVVRKCPQTIEAAIPLSGEMRQQAITFLGRLGDASIGFKGELDKDGEELDKLAGYLIRHFGHQVRLDGSESVSDVCIRLLDTIVRDPEVVLAGTTAEYLPPPAVLEGTAPDGEISTAVQMAEVTAEPPSYVDEDGVVVAQSSESVAQSSEPETAERIDSSDWEDHRRGTIGSIHDYRDTATPEPEEREGLLVGHFDPEELDMGPSERRTVGHVGTFEEGEGKPLAVGT